MAVSPSRSADPESQTEMHTVTVKTSVQWQVLSRPLVRASPWPSPSPSRFPPLTLALPLPLALTPTFTLALVLPLTHTPGRT